MNKRVRSFNRIQKDKKQGKLNLSSNRFGFDFTNLTWKMKKHIINLLNK